MGPGSLLLLAFVGLAVLWAAGVAGAAPDLTVSVAAPAGSLDLDTVPITVWLANGGTTGSSNTTVALAIDGTPIDPPLDFGPVAAGGALTRTASYALSCGRHALSATADPGDLVAETNESNNNGSTQAVVVPVASFTFSVTDLADGHDLLVNASSSHGCRPLAFHWSASPGAASATGETATLAVPAGNITVTLTATSLGDATLAHTTSRVVAVRNIPPTVTASFPATTVLTGVHVSLIVQAADADGEVTNFSVDLGDGNQTTSLVTASAHAYAAPGSYQVTVVVTDNLGGTAQAEASIEVLNRPPLVSADPPYWYGEQTQAVVIDALNSSDPEGGPLTYSWTFGDGTTGTGPVANHTYAAPAVYIMTLTVRDNDGAEANATIQVTVLPPIERGGGGTNLVTAGALVFIAVITIVYVAVQRQLGRQDAKAARTKVQAGPDRAAGQPGSEEE